MSYNRMYYSNNKGKFEENIEYVEEINDCYNAKYSNSAKIYPYKKVNLLVLNLIEIYERKDVYAYHGKQSLRFIKLLLMREQCSGESYFVTIGNGNCPQLYRKDDLKLNFVNKENNKYLDYFKEVADVVGTLKKDIESGSINILRRQYKYMSSVDPRTVLSVYLNKNLNEETCSKMHNIIFPFSYNHNQQIAVQKALSNKISLIKGPPGTGKTQTILNIIANLVMNGKTIAVVSNNNNAIKNIYDKYLKNGLSFFCAFLGNNTNIDNFIQSQSKDNLDLEEWILKPEEYKQLYRFLKKKDKIISNLLNFKIELALLKSELTELELEAHFFQTFLRGDNLISINFKHSKNYSDFFFEYNRTVADNKISLMYKTLQSIKYRKWLYGFYRQPALKINIALQDNYYAKRKSELVNLIDKYTNDINVSDPEKQMGEYTEKSLMLFKTYLAKRFNGQQTYFDRNTLKCDPYKFIERYPVVFSTTYSLKKSLSDDFVYDYLIIDEASQTDIITGALAMSCAENAVVVGDTKQLPNIIDNKKRETAHNIFKKYNFEHGYDYSQFDLMSSIKTLFPELSRDATLLNEHYRCHPMIIGFCNNRFYNDELIIMTKSDDDTQPMALYKTARCSKLCFGGTSPYNPRQVVVLENDIIRDRGIDINSDSVGIITPFRAQVNEIKKTITETATTEIDTIHKFQGREKDIIIFSTVKDKLDEGFIDDPMINVAVSRAAKQFYIMIPNDETEITNVVINDLISYIRRNHLQIINSNICSIFDLFHKQFSHRLDSYYEKYSKKYKKNDDVMSERLIQMLLDELLELSELSGLKYERNYPLYQLFNTSTHEIYLSEREKGFINNSLSHVDFLIINNCDKMPLLGIEIDGSYHLFDDRQKERDVVKNSVFEKFKLPFMRLSTRRSTEEKNKIYNELCRIRGVSK